MTTKEHFELLKKCGLPVNIPKIIKNRAQRYLDALLIPDYDKGGFKRDPIRCYAFGIKEEPINWGGLRVYNVVETVECGFLVTIDEADPSSRTLCDYLEFMLSLDGWKVKVNAEW